MIGLILAALFLSFQSPIFAVTSPIGLRPDHVVVVIEENKSIEDIIGKKDATYINRLASQGALMMESYAVAHPSLPNYFALFSGSTQGVKDDGCEYVLKGENLAQSLEEAGLTFKTFEETLPSSGFTQCKYLDYRKKHNPAAYFSTVSGKLNRPFHDFPTDFSRLPTVSFVIPNMDNDMHDGTIIQADGWLKKNIASYAQWAQSHNSLLILTWDEDDDTEQNHIVTIIVGDHVKPGKYKQHINHYNVLKTITAFYGVSSPHHAKESKPISGIWMP